MSEVTTIFVLKEGEGLPTTLTQHGTYLFPNNRVVWVAKGGQRMGSIERPRYISPSLAKDIRVAAKNGKVTIAASTLNRHLHKAATASGIILKGAEHPFRYFFAHKAYKAYRAQGLSHEEARREVAEDMGHHRAHTTDRYLCGLRIPD
jgi:hypothetical protein